MPAGYSVETAGDVALSAATAKTVLGYIGAANVTFTLVEASIGFDGTSGTAEPVTVELCRSTGATAGTSTAQSLQQLRGATRTSQCSGARNYTAEPTVLSVLKRWLVHPQTDRTFQLPLGREISHTGAGGLFLRCTAPATVNCQGYMEAEEG